MNEFLRTREQIIESSKWLLTNGYMNHPISCKDWELRTVIENIGDGDTLDMGADGSFVLHNIVKKGIKGRKVGIDLAEVTGINKAADCEYYVGDLMHTEFENESFDNVVCCSVIEHQVDLSEFAKEVSRLLRNNGKLYVSFDYWRTPIDTSLTKLYSLEWRILTRSDVKKLIRQCAINDLMLTGDVNWTTKDAVINDTYCSPAKGVEYSFGILEFIKKKQWSES